MVPSVRWPGCPSFELGNLEMPEITDNELWTLFTGKDAPPDNFEWAHDRCMNLIKQRELEAIKNFIATAPKLIDPNFLLRMVWLHQTKFNVGSLLYDDELPRLFKNFFILAKIQVDTQELANSLHRILNSLIDSEYIQSKRHYFPMPCILTEKGEIIAKEWFQNLVLEAESPKGVTVPPPIADPVPDDSSLTHKASAEEPNRKFERKQKFFLFGKIKKKEGRIPSEMRS